MNQVENFGVASQLLAFLAEGKETAIIAALFGENVALEIQAMPARCLGSDERQAAKQLPASSVTWAA